MTGVGRCFDGEVDDEEDGGHNFFPGLFIFGPFLIHGGFFFVLLILKKVHGL
jgi:hypothetical protein